MKQYRTAGPVFAGACISSALPFQVYSLDFGYMHVPLHRYMHTYIYMIECGAFPILEYKALLKTYNVLANPP